MPTIYKGVVIQDICCLDVIQVLGSDSLIGQADWIDSNMTTHNLFHNVFRVANPCQFNGHTAGDTITFIMTAPQVQNCACCMVFAYVPAKACSIQEVH